VDFIFRIAGNPMAINELTTADKQYLGRLALEVLDNASDPIPFARLPGDPRHLILVAMEYDLIEARAIWAISGGTRA